MAERREQKGTIGNLIREVEWLRYHVVMIHGVNDSQVVDSLDWTLARLRESRLTGIAPVCTECGG